MTEPKKRIVIHRDGGCIRKILCDFADPVIDVVVVDEDVEGCSDTECAQIDGVEYCVFAEGLQYAPQLVQKGFDAHAMLYSKESS